MPHRPKISVLVFTYDRKEFLKEALQSALNQTLPREEYEVICVVGFRDPELSRFMAESGVREAYFGENMLGERIALGIEQCSGDVVALMNDDDVFAPDKLRCVLEAFTKYDIVYYHNNVYYMDRYSRPLEHYPYSRQIERSFVCHPTECLGYILKHRGDFNGSSIAVRRDAMLRHIEEMRKITVAEDSAIFFLLLDEGAPYYFDSRKLTGYRLHDSTTISLRIDVDKFVALSRMRYTNMKYLLNHIGHPEAKRWLKAYALESKFSGYIWGAAELKPTPHETLELAAIGLRTVTPNFLRLAGAALAKRIASNTVLARRIERTRRRLQRILDQISMAGSQM